MVLGLIDNFKIFKHCYYIRSGHRKQKKPKGTHGGARPGAGRPTKQTPTVEEVLLEAITLGLSLGKACSLVGIAAETFIDWREKDPELAERVEAARAKGIKDALVQLHMLKRTGDIKAITWFLEKMDRATYGPPATLVSAAQQNNYLLADTVQAVELTNFIRAQRERLALARSLQENEPERAAKILSETIEIDSEADLLDGDGPEEDESAEPVTLASYENVRTSSQGPIG
jgi:hypothetical protein